jgi:hypothetical protein
MCNQNVSQVLLSYLSQRLSSLSYLLYGSSLSYLA